MIKIFISHNTKDIEIVQFLEKILKTYGYTPYIAERDYQAGKPLSQKIMNNIDNSTCLSQICMLLIINRFNIIVSEF